MKFKCTFQIGSLRDGQISVRNFLKFCDRLSPPRKSPKIAVFENSTEKNLMNGQSAAAILRSGNLSDSHKLLSAIDVTAEAIC